MTSVFLRVYSPVDIIATKTRNVRTKASDGFELRKLGCVLIRLKKNVDLKTSFLYREFL